MTYGGLAAGQSFVADLLAASDAAVFTYYPLNERLYGARSGLGQRGRGPHGRGGGQPPVLIQEADYPSGYRPEFANGSSDDLQRQFFAALFEALSAQPQVRMVSVTQLADWPDAACDSFLNYYGTDAPRFREYLCSLGLYTADAQPKPAFQAFLDGFALVP